MRFLQLRNAAVFFLTAVVAASGSAAHSEDSVRQLNPPLRAPEPLRRPPIYSPTLPSDQFLNDQQAKIYQERCPKAEDFIYFADSIDASKPELKALHRKLKSWTAEEKSDISKMMQRLTKRAPGLLIRACSGGKLALCRIDAALPTGIGGPHLPDNPAAFSSQNALVFTDSFFSLSNQFHGLAHELVHQADMAGRLSFSKEWVQFINPTIIETRMKMSVSSYTAFKQITEQLRAQNLCPTAYSCAALPEALAEMTATYIADEGFEFDSRFVDKFAKRLLVPVDDEMADDHRYKLGTLHYRTGDYSTAVELLSQAVDHEPKLAMAQCFLSGSLLSVRKFDEGQRHAQLALECFKSAGVPPTDRDIQTVFDMEVYGFQLSHEPNKIVSVMDTFLNEVPYHSKALHTRYTAERSLHKYSAAVRDLYLACYESKYASLLSEACSNPDFYRDRLSEDIAKFPQVESVYGNRGHFYEWLGDRELNKTQKSKFYILAQTDYDRAAELEATNQNILDCLHLALKLSTSITTAQKYLTHLQTLAPDSVEARIAQIELLDASGNASEAQDKLAQLLVRSGDDFKIRVANILGSSAGPLVSTTVKCDYNAQVKTITSDIQKQPNNEKLYRERAELFEYQKQHKSAIADLTTAISLNKSNPQNYVKRAEAYDSLGERLNAVADYTKAIAIDPKNADYYDSRGWEYCQLDQHKNEIADYTIAISLDPQDEYAYRNRGNEYLRADNYQLALRDLNKACSLDPTDHVAYGTRGRVYKELKQYKKAEEDITFAISLSQDDADLYYFRAQILELTKGPDVAITDLNNAVALSPKDPYIRNERGYLLAIKKRHKEAVEDFTQAIAADPSDQYAYLNRGLSLLELNDINRALADINKAIKLNPKDGQAYQARAHAYNALKMYNLAIADLNRAIIYDAKNKNEYEQERTSYKEAAGSVHTEKSGSTAKHKSTVRK